MPFSPTSTMNYYTTTPADIQGVDALRRAMDFLTRDHYSSPNTAPKVKPVSPQRTHKPRSFGSFIRALEEKEKGTSAATETAPVKKMRIRRKATTVPMFDLYPIDL